MAVVTDGSAVSNQAPRDDEMIRFRDVHRYFPARGGPLGIRSAGAVRAVDGISLTVRAGETLALVGESGCGKTTTAKMLLRLDSPSAGMVTLDGRDIHRMRGAELRRYRMSVQAVLQDPWSSLDPRMRVHEIVSEALVVNQKPSRPAIRAAVDAILHQVGLNSRQADLFPHEFSGGQRQRIALAAALITQPRLVVLDEPVSALDVSVRAQVMNLLGDIQRDQGTAYLLIAHDLATVRYLSHRVVVMYLGRIVEEADVEDLFAGGPRHPYTQALFAASLPTHPDTPRTGELPTGEPPSPIDPPSGCHFRTRCPFAMPRCAAQAPTPTLVSAGHRVSCHLVAAEPTAAGRDEGVR